MPTVNIPELMRLLDEVKAKMELDKDKKRERIGQLIKNVESKKGRK